MTNYPKVSSGVTIAFPDVCKTPAPPNPVPIPYPDIAKSAQSKQQHKKPAPAAINKASSFSRRSGDEGGRTGGIKTNVLPEATALKNRLNTINTKIQGLSPQQPKLWQEALEDYAVTASALYTTLNPD